MANSKKFIALALKEAFAGIKAGHGGPFGAVIVRKGKVIAKAHNMVIAKKDSTAHAEILAIKKASKKLKRFSLSDCEIFSTCEPCPMCLAAIHWARIKKAFFGCSRKDAAAIGFADKLIYDSFARRGKGLVKTKRLCRKDCLRAFRGWEKSPDKRLY